MHRGVLHLYTPLHRGVLHLYTPLHRGVLHLYTPRLLWLIKLINEKAHHGSK